jgi:predicted hydrocarbon binding protein
VRDKVELPLCEFYAAAIRRLLYLFSVDADVEIQKCRATGADGCVLTVTVRAVTTGVAA